MSNEITNLCRPLRIRPTPKCVLMALADRADDDGVAWPSIAWLCGWTCFSRRAVINALDELEVAGLVRIGKAAGKNSRCEIVLEKVAAEATHPGTTCTTTRAGGAHGGAGGAPDTSIDINKTSNKTRDTRAKSGFDALKVELPDWLPAETWADWVKDRADRKKPVTETSAKVLLRSLERLRNEGNDPVTVIEQSIERGWQGFFATKDGTKPANAQQVGLAADHPVRAQIAALPPEWWKLAGFETEWDAKTQRCWWNNYTEFQNGKRVRSGEGVPA